MMPRSIERALLFLRTTRHLRASQIVHRARLRAQRWRGTRPLMVPFIEFRAAKCRGVAGWPTTFTALDLLGHDDYPAAAENAAGHFRFLNEDRELGWPADWSPSDVPRLWHYHLHYMEWAWSFAAHGDRRWARGAFADLWRSWEASAPLGRGDAWSPYVASLRAWVLCGVYASLIKGSDVQPAVDASLARHAAFLWSHLEHDVGGNHLVKNLKAVAGLGVLLDQPRLVDLAKRHLERQVRVQVLADGGHYERSPSYHCQVLGDFIDVQALLESAGHSPLPGLSDAIEAMRVWLGIIRLPDGDVPLFNDCALVGAERLARLDPGPPATERLTVLAASGYVVVRPNARVHLVADVGDPCPPDLPAHAHADTLSFELAIDGTRFVVDSGTSTYESGAQRAFERSTAAHNTVCIDDADQTEVWGAFRAARLARPRLERAVDAGESLTVIASHAGYRRLRGRPVHRRSWIVTSSQIEIVDEIAGRGRHDVAARLHLATAAAPSADARIVSAGRATIECLGPQDMSVRVVRGRRATGFGSFADCDVVTARCEGPLPIMLRTVLGFDGAAPPGTALAASHADEMKGSQ